MSYVLRARGLSKSFKHRDAARAPTFRGWVEGGFAANKGKGRFFALRGVSLDVTQGEMVGVIGRNGSGKSTLLRLLGGVLQPDVGRVEARAAVRGLLELNAGMHPDLSGRENILIAGVLGGLLRSEVLARMDDIITFAELEPHIDQPVRTYSSGMKLRLGFSVAVHVDPEILLIDEVLAVGDLAFQEKCLARIDEFRRNGCGIVLISHDMGQIRRACDQVIWLDAGEVKMQGKAERVIDAYEAASNELIAAQKAEGRAGDTDRAVRFGSGKVTISEVALLDGAGMPAGRLVSGSALSVRFRVAGSAPAGAHVSVSITDERRQVCFDASSDTDELTLQAINGPQEIRLDLDRLDLAPGRYHVSVGAWSADWSAAYDMHEECYVLEVIGGPQLQGVLSPPRRWSYRPLS